MSECIFCKIIAKEIPNHTVYEDDNVLAFLDIHPCALGHTVVIPKKHYKNIAGLNPDEWGVLAVGLKKAAERVEEILQPDGLNIGLNNNPAAGQAVPHLHWHILPRWQNDGGGSMHAIIKNPGDVSVVEVAKKFQS